jgi:hypothetical protein
MVVQTTNYVACLAFSLQKGKQKKDLVARKSLIENVKLRARKEPKAFRLELDPT